MPQIHLKDKRTSLYKKLLILCDIKVADINDAKIIYLTQ
jgi:hypothetical protein